MNRDEELQDILPEHFYWRPVYGVGVRADGAIFSRTGKITFGHTVGHGYREVHTRLGKRRVHRLVIELAHGKSELQVNHKNGIRSDNRLGNLEYVTNQENVIDGFMRNKARGCHFYRPTGKWQAYIRRDGVKSHLGCYDTEEEAHAVYLEAISSFMREGVEA